MKAIISGASRGIGKAIAEKLAAMQYDLVLIARNEEGLSSLKEELLSAHAKLSIATLPFDLSRTNAIKSHLQDNSELLQGCNLLVNNLGVYHMDKVAPLKLEDVKKQLEVNLYSAIELSNACLPFLYENKSAQIINIGSVMSLEAEKIATSYSISKHAFKAWNDSLREELRAKNIKVSCIYPGAVNTSSWDGIEADRAAMIQAEDIAELVKSICSLGPSSLVEEIRMSPLNFIP